VMWPFRKKPSKEPDLVGSAISLVAADLFWECAAEDHKAAARELLGTEGAHAIRVHAALTMRLIQEVERLKAEKAK
jgi:hypothetical protein